MKKILIGSPIKQKRNILIEFLESLKKLDLKGYDVHYYFIDDNDDKKTSEMLEKFKKQQKNVILTKSLDIPGIKKVTYTCDKNGHMWKKDIIKKISILKNIIIDYARKENFDYLFFLDSDILLLPTTIKHLISRNVDIVSNIFWTQWVENGKIYPQVWLEDTNNLYKTDWDKKYTNEEKDQFAFDFINQLKVPGIYEVGGLGACTLISKKAINSGVNFSIIDNVSFWGEDRHFCIRARVLGFKLFVDTVYPAFHIYREEYLKYTKDFFKKGFDFSVFKYSPLKLKIKHTKKIDLRKIYYKYKNKYLKLKKILFLRKRIISSTNKIVLSMIVKNEANNFLTEVLTSAIEYVDEVVIIDDASDDNTVELCEEILKDIPHRIIKNKVSMFSVEYKLRMKQWRETLKSNPDWILFLDADDIFENKMKTSIRELVKNTDVDLFCFRYYDMWNKYEYRSDEYWQGHLHYRPMLLRYQPKFPYRFRKTKQHCGTLPKNVFLQNYCNSDIRCKHMGWSREIDRKRKYDRYMKLDGKGKFGNIKQYESIMDANPNLVRFEDEN